MTATDLLVSLHQRGITITLGNEPNRLRLEATKGSVRPEVLATVAQHKQDLLSLLSARPAPVISASDPALYSQVTIGDQRYPYCRRWSGQTLSPADGFLAFDTETAVVDLKREVPHLALASASAGEASSSLVHPDDLGQFLLTHQGLRFVCHNAAFDFWVVEQHLRRRGAEEALRAWWAIADENRLHDSMLLDALARLAHDDSYREMRDLATVAREYAGLEIAKNDLYRLRYSEIIGTDWKKVEPGFFTYAIKDAIVTKIAYLAIRKRAEALLHRFGQHSTDITADAVAKYGLLTEAVQVKKAIALAQITRNGMHVDLDAVRQGEARLRQELLDAVAAAQAIFPVYKMAADGRFLLSGKSAVPAFDDKVLRSALAEIKDSIERAEKVELSIRVLKTGISRSLEVWTEHAHRHPFLEHWVKAQGVAKLLQFFAQFHDRVNLEEVAVRLQTSLGDLAKVLRLGVEAGNAPVLVVDDLLAALTKHGQQLASLGIAAEQVVAAVHAQAAAHRQAIGRIHPSYSVMVRTGRTSCSSPNIQQIPRNDEFRQAFVAPPGHFLLTADYSFIELRTLAATALHRYGRSSGAVPTKDSV